MESCIDSHWYIFAMKSCIVRHWGHWYIFVMKSQLSFPIYGRLWLCTVTCDARMWFRSITCDCRLWLITLTWVGLGGIGGGDGAGGGRDLRYNVCCALLKNIVKVRNTCDCNWDFDCCGCGGVIDCGGNDIFSFIMRRISCLCKLFSLFLFIYYSSRKII